MTPTRATGLPSEAQKAKEGHEITFAITSSGILKFA